MIWSPEHGSPAFTVPLIDQDTLRAKPHAQACNVHPV